MSKGRYNVLDGFMLVDAAEAEAPEEVTAVTLKGQLLDGFEEGDMQYFEHLKIMDLSDNFLADLAPLALLESLTHLFAPGNVLRHVDLHHGPFHQLETLDLSFNHLEGDCLDVLGEFPRLKSLDLSNNGLGPLPADLVGFPALEVLKLNRCGLAAEGLGSLMALGKLRKLHARENPLAAVPPLDGGGDGPFKALELLDLSHCRIARKADVVGVTELPRLKTLVLTGNACCGAADFAAGGPGALPCNIVTAEDQPRKPVLGKFYSLRAAAKGMPKISEDVSIGKNSSLAFLPKDRLDRAFEKVYEEIEELGEEIVEKEIEEREELREDEELSPAAQRAAEEAAGRRLSLTEIMALNAGGGPDGEEDPTFLTRAAGGGGADGAGGPAPWDREAGGAGAEAGGEASPEAGAAAGEEEDPTVQLAHRLGMDVRGLAAVAPMRQGTDAKAAINALKFALEHPLASESNETSFTYERLTQAALHRRAATQRSQKAATTSAKEYHVNRIESIETLLENMKSRVEAVRQNIKAAKQSEEAAKQFLDASARSIKHLQFDALEPDPAKPASAAAALGYA